MKIIAQVFSLSKMLAKNVLVYVEAQSGITCGAEG